MPSRKEERASPGPKKAKRKRRRFPRGGPTKAELRKLKEALLKLRAEILKSSQNLADEALKSVGQDYSVEHMADAGTDHFDQEFSLLLLEGEAEIFRAICTAIEKIEGRAELPYGICEDCVDEEPAPDSEHRCPTCPWIAKGRLDAVPYARLCVVRQELEEQEGA